MILRKVRANMSVPQKRLSPRANLQPADELFIRHMQNLHHASRLRANALRNCDGLFAAVASSAVKAAGLQIVRYVLTCDRSRS